MFLRNFDGRRSSGRALVGGLQVIYEGEQWRFEGQYKRQCLPLFCDFLQGGGQRPAFYFLAKQGLL